ncbi:glycoside hydrolase [Rickenella mellea]|uniref:cellulase n=1 Tax=Rickenella mellea TaxID=50990 RepID=A0A4Y7QLW4_9AGAM|nr:glycoside hydrolase [Rickenella mellea]
MRLSSFTTLAVLLASSVPALSTAVWGQCGGIGFTGSTTCDPGTTCTVLNPSPTTSSKPATTSKPTTTSTTTYKPPISTTSSAAPPSGTGPGGTCPGRTKFKFFGVNESGAEFGSAIPGVLGKDYTWPSPSSIDYFVGQGFNAFRVPFMMERLSPSGLTGGFDATYLSGLMTIVNYITSKGAYAAIDPHNYMRYNGQIISSTSDFQTWWKNLAGQFSTNSHVIFDVMNEPNGIDATTVFNLNQAAVYGIRSSGATSQLILVEGTSWTGAWSWVSSGNGAVFGAIKDPNNNTAIQMHQYLDSDSSGTSPTCVSPTIGAERLAAATAWLQANNLKGFLGEIAACISAVSGALCTMQQSGVWIGATWWAAGPWWGTYFTSIEPPSGAAVSQILPQALMPYL